MNSLDELTNKVIARDLQSKFNLREAEAPVKQDEALEEFYSIIEEN